MWIERDFSKTLESSEGSHLPIKVLKGPRQVGKTSILAHLKTHELVLFDDLSVRMLAKENPALFFSKISKKVILDEATLVPEIFLELKKMVDEERRLLRDGKKVEKLDIWVTGSNQTLLQKSVRESLAGRASYFDLNTLSLNELKQIEPIKLQSICMKGGWPELYVSPKLNTVQYLNDFISTFIEKDIVISAGIEKRSAFNKLLQLCAARVGQLLNYSDLAQNIGVDVTTVQSWVTILEKNGIIKIVAPYYNNLNKRLIKTPKIYFEDVALAARLQGWTEFTPMSLSPYFGSLLENLAFIEIKRFFANNAIVTDINFVRSKEKVEIDFLIKLTNNRFIVAEVKTTAANITRKQQDLINSLKLNIVEHWCLSPIGTLGFACAKSISFENIAEELNLANINSKG